MCDLDEFHLGCHCLRDFPNIQTLRKEQEICFVNLARGKDGFVILPNGFVKAGFLNLSDELFPGLANAAMKSEMCSIVVVSPLVSVLRYLVEQLKQLDSQPQQLSLMKNSRKMRKQRERGSVR